MRKTIFVLFLLLTSGYFQYSFGQKVYFGGLSFSANLSNVHRSVDKTGLTPYNLFSYSFGVPFIIKSNEKLEWETGIFYSMRGYQTGIVKVDSAEIKIINNIEVNEVSFQYQFHYIDIPLKVNWNPFDKNNFYLTGGLNLGIYLTSGLNLKMYLESTRVVYDYIRTPAQLQKSSALSLEGILGAGYRFPLNEKFMLRAEGMFRHPLNPRVSTENNQEYIYTLGLNLGFIYRFP